MPKLSREYLDLKGLEHLVSKIEDRITSESESVVEITNTQFEALDNKYLQKSSEQGEMTSSIYVMQNGVRYATYTNTDSVLYTDGKTLTEVLSGVEQLNAALEVILHGNS